MSEICFWDNVSFPKCISDVPKRWCKSSDYFWFCKYFRKKNAQEGSPERFLEVFIDVFDVIQQFFLS